MAVRSRVTLSPQGCKHCSQSRVPGIPKLCPVRSWLTYCLTFGFSLRLQRYGHSFTVAADIPHDDRNWIPSASALGVGSGKPRAIVEHVGLGTASVADSQGSKHCWHTIGSDKPSTIRPVKSCEEQFPVVRAPIAKQRKGHSSTVERVNPHDDRTSRSMLGSRMDGVSERAGTLDVQVGLVVVEGRLLLAEGTLLLAEGHGGRH